MQTKTDISILALRGVHSLSSVPEIVTKLKSADIVIIEAPGPKSSMQWLSGVLDGASMDKEFAKRAQKVLTTPPNSNYFICQLGWALQGSGKHIVLGDVHWDDDTPYEKSPANYLSAGGIEAAMQASIKHPVRRYIVWNEFFARAAGIVKQRDALVATQTSQIIEAKDKYPMSDVLAKKDHCAVAIVQGYLHNSGLLLQEKYTVTEQLFNKEDIDDLHVSVTYNYLHKKVEDSTIQFTNKEIDFLLFSMAVSGLNLDETNYEVDGKSNLEIDVEVSQSNNDHPAWTANKQAAEELGSIDNWNAQELAANVEEWLKFLADNTDEA